MANKNCPVTTLGTPKSSERLYSNAAVSQRARILEHCKIDGVLK